MTQVATRVAVMQSTESWQRDDLAPARYRRGLNTTAGRVLPQSEMSPVFVFPLLVSRVLELKRPDAPQCQLLQRLGFSAFCSMHLPKKLRFLPKNRTVLSLLLGKAYCEVYALPLIRTRYFPPDPPLS